MVQAGTLFGYLAAFVTIVLGLALADFLVSLHRLLRARRRVVWRPLPLLLALFAMLSLLTGFFELWEMTRWESISYFGLVWQILLAIPLFLVTCAVLPDDVPPGTFDFENFYVGERHYICALLAADIILDIADAALRNRPGHAGDLSFLLSFYLPLNLLVLAGIGFIGWSQAKWVQWLAFAILFGAAGVGYASWSIGGADAIALLPPLSTTVIVG